MSIEPTGNATVLLLQRSATGKDALNAKTYSYLPVPMPGAVFAPGTTTELVQGQDLVTTQPTVYAPPGLPVATPVDRMQVDGVTYEVDGGGDVWTDPWEDAQVGQVIKLEAVAG